MTGEELHLVFKIQSCSFYDCNFIFCSNALKSCSCHPSCCPAPSLVTARLLSPSLSLPPLLSLSLSLLLSVSLPLPCSCSLSFCPPPPACSPGVLPQGSSLLTHTFRGGAIYVSENDFQQNLLPSSSVTLPSVNSRPAERWAHR